MTHVAYAARRSALFVALVAGCSQTPLHDGGDAVPAQTPPPKEPTCVWAGVLVPRQSMEVHAPGAGEVTHLPVEVGQRVVAEDVVAIVHDPELAFDLVAARAALDESRARRRRAEAHLDRRRAQAEISDTLARSGHLSDAEGADAALEARSAALERAAAKAVEATDASLIHRLAGRRDQHVLRASWPARVAARRVEIGARVERGAPLLRLVDDGPPRVRFGVSPAAAGDFSPGALVQLRVEGHAEVTARVRHVGTVQDLGTLAVSIDADLVDGPSDLRAGLGVWAWRPGHDTECGLPAVSLAALDE